MSAFPAGADTSCQVGNLKMIVGEAGKHLKASDFLFRMQNKWQMLL
ncbi:MTH865 family protein [Methanospirillum sp.]